MPGRLPGRNKWSEKELGDALRQIKENNVKIQTASKLFNIPRRTLRDYLSKGLHEKSK